MKLKFAVRGGHNKNIRGSSAMVGKIKMDEVEIDRDYYPLVIKYLKELGHEVLDVTPKATNTKSQDLEYGVALANKWGADVFISCHVNASDGNGHGCEVVYSPKSVAGIKYATNISNSIAKLGYKNRGPKADTRGLYELRHTNMTAIIIEPFFLDNIKDVNTYTSTGAEVLAKAIVEGITGNKIKNNLTVINSGDDDMISDTIKIFANENSPIALKMKDYIKELQGMMGIPQDGIATEKLVKLLPEFKGAEQRGSVTTMQKILELKCYGKDISTGVTGPACKSAIERFKHAQGIPLDTKLVDRQTWRKLLEY